MSAMSTTGVDLRPIKDGGSRFAQVVKREFGFG
jgi:hypothetical protein